MKKNSFQSKAGFLSLPLSALSLAISAVTLAQDEPSGAVLKPPPIEEVLILGRLQSSAQDLTLERMELEVPVDLLGAEQIGRIGDSTAAVALKRVPGITLVDGKFVYVRGLGERYSSSTLNGATVPSPDLTRNVIPLDIFPASIIKSIAVQKGFTANMPATFGGGNIDLRTKGIPEEFVFSIEASGGMNSISSDYLDYKGGSDDSWGTDDGTRALSSDISYGLTNYFSSLNAAEPSLSPNSIQASAARRGEEISDEQAAALNATMAAGIYSDLDINENSSSLQDSGFSVSVGNVFDFGDNFQFGVMATGDYDTSIRNQERTIRTFRDPEDEFTTGTRTTENVSITASLNFGLRWGEDHEVESKNLFIRNTDDDVSKTYRFNNSASFGSGNGFVDYDYRFEQRELEVYQITGSHTLGYDTKEALGLGERLSFLDDLELTWFYSDSEASTEIPSETNIEGSISRNLESDSIDVLSTRLVQKARMVDVRFTELEDSVESSGFELSLPISAGSWAINLSGGGKYDKKTRIYEQLDLSIGPNNSAVNDSLSGNISTALSEANITNPAYEYEITYQDGLSRSYMAAAMTDAFFGSADFFWNDTFRVVLGARYEEYKQFSAAYHPYRVIGNRIDIDDVTDLQEGESPESVFYLEEVYPSLALTYVIPDFWAQDFSLRFSASETVVLPDLREISPSSYQDPLTDIVVSGNPDAIQSDLTNYDLRAEWFFSTGDNLTVSLFYKDITSPIEYFLDTGTEDSLSATIENAESGNIQGIEFEWLKSLEFLGYYGEAFFLSGNLTLAESELTVGDQIEVSVTNRERPLRGASEYVANFQFGYDSDDGKHAATLVYNVFGERVYTAGVGDEPDAYEQPFAAVDLSYTFFPTDNFTVKFKARNLLDEKVLISQGNVDVFEAEVGQSYSLGVKYTY